VVAPRPERGRQRLDGAAVALAPGLRGGRYAAELAFSLIVVWWSKAETVARTRRATRPFAAPAGGGGRARAAHARRAAARRGDRRPMAATNKCLARNNKSETGDKATNE
jgi:hypothetical protein